MTLKNRILTAVGVVVLVAVAVFAVVKSGIIPIGKEEETTTTVPYSETTAVTPTEMTIITTTTTEPTTEEPTETEEPSFSEIEMNKMSMEEAIDQVNDAVNKAKLGKNFKVTDDKIVQTQLDDCSSKVYSPLVMSMANDYSDEKVNDYTFADGIAKDSSDKTVDAAQVLPPAGEEFKIDPEAITDYTVFFSSGVIVYTFSFLEEKTVLAEPLPKYQSKAFNCLVPSNYYAAIEPAKITDCTITYTGGTITAEIDDNGNLVSFKEYLPLSADVSGVIDETNISAKISGFLDETWTFNW